MTKYSKIFTKLEILLERVKDLKINPSPHGFAKVQKDLLRLKLELSSRYLIILSRNDIV